MAFDGVMELMSALDSLKHLKRTGWVKMGIPEPETVACHMYRMAVLAMSLEGQIDGLDTARTMMMSLVHDLSEAIVGDITPHCGISDKDKYDLESKAMRKIASFVPLNCVGERWIELWEEYELQETLTAKIVKHLDKFDMVVQAFEYERKYAVSPQLIPQLTGEHHVVEHATYGVLLEQFFDSTKTSFTMSPFVEWDRELRSRRKKWLENNKTCCN